MREKRTQFCRFCGDTQNISQHLLHVDKLEEWLDQNPPDAPGQKSGVVEICRNFERISRVHIAEVRRCAAEGREYDFGPRARGTLVVDGSKLW